MIKKILIANRGEIALRVIKTCKQLGIETVTIYAQNDTFLPHASAGDENILLKGDTLQETYLNIENIIKICKELNVDAVHPGYGFLSENAQFANALASEKVIFIGPNVHAIELMGDKTASKVAMEKIGIPLVPGYHGSDQDPENLLAEAKKITFPVLIKASAGGGGKGMRIVHHEEEFIKELEGAKREAKNAFGNDEVLVEKYIEKPRHIEVQLVSDGKGNHFHFFERECSIQRRYQKVIEEAPAVNLSIETKQKMFETAINIAKGIHYIGAGTIEYIVDSEENFYFLEMNTRLQVEHPITELTTGFDLVELQIRAASGEAFDFSQDEVEQFGHAIECRIYSEDPDNDFLPTAGKIHKVETKALVDYRLDSGYVDNNKISTHYDPMLAKLITWDGERIECIDKMQTALSSVIFAGAKTNRDYLKRILDHDEFLEGNLTTHFLKHYERDLKKNKDLTIDHLIAFAGLVFKDYKKTPNIWGDKFSKLEKIIILNDNEYKVILIHCNSDQVVLEFDGQKFNFDLLERNNNHLLIQHEGIAHILNYYLYDHTGAIHLFINESEFIGKLIPKAKGSSSEQEMGEGSLQSPMPGKIFKVIKTAGDAVEKGEPIMIVEAMKMEHTIKSPMAGTIKEFFYKEGDQVQGGVLLCEIDS